MKRGNPESMVILLPDGRQGELEGGQVALTAARRSGSHITVIARDGERMVFPAASVLVGTDGTCRVDSASREVEAAGPLLNEAGEAVTVLPVVEEQLHVSREKRVTGHVRVTKTVREEKAVVDEPLLTERVEVERIPVNRPIGEIPGSRQEGDVLVLPVVEEVLVVEKRLVLKEEIRIRRVREEKHAPQHVTLLREEVQVERTGTGEGTPGTGRKKNRP